jgi:hypothetical protein
MTAQSKFTVTLPTTDQSTPPNALTTGQLTQLDFVIGTATYSWAIPATTEPGATVVVTFAETTPPFVPVAGTTYTADAFAVDAAGNGALSNSQTWTEAAAPTAPAGPTGFTVS